MLFLEFVVSASVSQSIRAPSDFTSRFIIIAAVDVSILALRDSFVMLDKAIAGAKLNGVVTLFFLILVIDCVVNVLVVFVNHPTCVDRVVILRDHEVIRSVSLVVAFCVPT